MIKLKILSLALFVNLLSIGQSDSTKFNITGHFVGEQNVETSLFMNTAYGSSLIAHDIFDSVYTYSLELGRDYFIVFNGETRDYKIFMGVEQSTVITLDVHFKFTEKPNAFIIYNDETEKYDLHTFTDEEKDKLLGMTEE